MRALKNSVKVLSMLLISTSAISFAGTIQDGNVSLRVTDTVIQEQSIYYKTGDSSDRASLFIESEGTELKGVLRDNQVMAYAKTPLNFLYYVLELKPKRTTIMDKAVIIREERGNGRSGCSEGANALLKAYRGDGTFTASCVTLNDKINN